VFVGHSNFRRFRAAAGIINRCHTECCHSRAIDSMITRAASNSRADYDTPIRQFYDRQRISCPRDHQRPARSGNRQRWAVPQLARQSAATVCCDYTVGRRNLYRLRTDARIVSAEDTLTELRPAGNFKLKNSTLTTYGQFRGAANYRREHRSSSTAARIRSLPGRGALTLAGGIFGTGTCC